MSSPNSRVSKLSTGFPCIIVFYCDGFEYAGKPVAAYGKGDKGAELAVMMKYWMADVVACSDGTEVSAQATRKLAEHNIPLRTEPIRYLEGADGELTKIVFESGLDLPRAGVRAFRLAASRAAARTVVTAATVLRTARSSIPPPL